MATRFPPLLIKAAYLRLYRQLPLLLPLEVSTNHPRPQAPTRNRVHCRGWVEMLWELWKRTQMGLAVSMVVTVALALLR